jgi:hypothetical protein
VPLRCSCGAALPEDARFCHKCGAPQYEEDIARINAVDEAVEETPAPAPVAPPAAVLPAPTRFPNGQAVRVSIQVAALSLLVAALLAVIAPPLVVPLFVVAGFAAVRLYANRTREILKPIGAAVMGAMPWFWFFLLQAAGALFLFFSPQVHDVIKAMNNPDYTRFIDDPAREALFLFVNLVVSSGSGALGGILGVRWQPRNGPSH